MRSVALAAALTLALTGCAARAAAVRQQRAMQVGVRALERGDPDAALAACAEAERFDGQYRDALPCAYALALAGVEEPALAVLDRAAARQDRGVACVAAEIHALTGADAVADELRPADRSSCPRWLPARPPDARAAAAATPPRRSEAARAFLAANALAERGANHQAVGAFRRAVAGAPGEVAPLVGYSIALERIGAVRAAAAAAEDAARADPDAARAESLRAHAADLRAPRTAKARAVALAGGAQPRFTAYGGGSVTSVSGETSGALSARAGVLLGSSFDAAVDATFFYDDSLVTTLGISSRSWRRLGSEVRGVASAGVFLDVGEGALGVTYGVGVQLAGRGAAALDLMLQGSWTSGSSGVSVLLGATRYFGR